MIFGNLSTLFENEQNLYNIVTESRDSSVPKQGRISKILTSLSHYGMNYNDKVLKNMVAVPADKNLLGKEEALYQQTLFGMNAFGMYKQKGEEEKDFAQKSLEQKFQILRKMAGQQELEDILDIMTNEAVVPDEDQAYICQPFMDTGLIQDLNEKSADEIRSAMDTAFYKIYMLLDWKRIAWDQFKKWLIDGVLCFEIIYDNLQYPKSITAIIPLDPSTLTCSYDETGMKIWTQYKGQIGRERMLLDAQIIYVKYEDTGVTQRQSYLERLIRPFNIYRIIEQAQIIWTVTQSSFKTKFTVPIAGMSRSIGAQTLSEAMNRYREDISFNSETGELKVNDKVNLPFNKEYWMPENDNGTPQIETIVDNGPQLNDSEQISWYLQKLYKSSKIPSSRFDKDSQSQWFGTDPTQALREEINFTRYVNRLRDVWGEILLKPLRIQVSLVVPDIKNDKRILDAISLRFNSYNLFEEMMNLEVLTKRIEFIGSIKDSLVITDDEGNEIPYFSPKFLIMKFLKMSDADIELNEKIKLEEQLAKKSEKKKDEEESDEKTEDKPEEDEESGSDNNDSNSESDESSELDSEMLGDVKPESGESSGL